MVAYYIRIFLVYRSQQVCHKKKSESNNTQSSKQLFKIDGPLLLKEWCLLNHSVLYFTKS